LTFPDSLGLLLSTDKKWHSRRKIITPAFHFKILEEFFSIMEGQGNIFINNLERFENQHFDIIPCVSLYTLDVICGKKNLS
jgi:cytochrome P450 family 4